jgi:hypothetical protein
VKRVIELADTALNIAVVAAFLVYAVAWLAGNLLVSYPLATLTIIALVMAIVSVSW